MHDAVLLLVDIQNDYFPGGRMVVPGSEPAAANAARLLAWYRRKGHPVIHMRHESVRPGSTFFLPGTPGARIHASVAPIGDEPVILKHFPNAFRETDLAERIRECGRSHVLVVGMMTNMCVDATVRAAFDLGFACTVAHDACAAPGLSFDGLQVPAEHVHAAFMAALASVYARVDATAALLAGEEASSP